ncbi:MAG: hypothetical protein ACOC6N_02925 [archaeon]
MYKGGRDNTFVLVLGVFLVIAGLGFGLMHFVSSVEGSLAEDTQKYYYNYSDISDLDDETDTGVTTEPLDTSDIPDPDPDDGDDDDTFIEDPTDEPDVSTAVQDYSLKGSVSVKAEMIGASGSVLSIVQQSFVKSQGGEAIDKLRIRYEWDFQLGEDLNPESFKINVKGVIRDIYYRDLLDTHIRGSITGNKIFDATGFDTRGWDTQTFDIDDPDLRFIEVKDYGSGNMLVYTTTDSFVLEWTVTVETDGGTTKKIHGESGIALNMYWDRETSDTYVPSTEQSQLRDWLHLESPYDYDPESDQPLMSIVRVG